MRRGYNHTKKKGSPIRLNCLLFRGHFFTPWSVCASHHHLISTQISTFTHTQTPVDWIFIYVRIPTKTIIHRIGSNTLPIYPILYIGVQLCKYVYIYICTKYCVQSSDSVSSGSSGSSNAKQKIPSTSSYLFSSSSPSSPSSFSSYFFHLIFFCG